MVISIILYMAKKTRCAFCQKKTGLINFTCQCQKIFCVVHRCSHSHNCTHKKEKKETSKQQIQTKNPKMGPQKVTKV